MTREERNNKLKYLITCMKCKVSSKCCDENCPTQYDAGNVGEIIENLEEISKILEQEPCDDISKKERWIPCSERLPKENEYVDGVCKYYLIQNEYGDMYVAYYTHVGWIPINSLFALGDDVVAWMSLPEPYNAEMENENVCNGCYYNDGKVHAECVVCAKAEKMP